MTSSCDMWEARSLSNLVAELIREYQRRLILRRRLGHAVAAPEPVIAARPQRTPRRPEAKPHEPAPDYKLRQSHL